MLTLTIENQICVHIPVYNYHIENAFGKTNFKSNATVHAMSFLFSFKCTALKSRKNINNIVSKRSKAVVVIFYLIV